MVSVWKMSKPTLRAGLEADLKLVCEGRKTKEVVLQEQVRLALQSCPPLLCQVEVYREVFRTTQANMGRLDAATAHYMGEQPSGEGLQEAGEWLAGGSTWCSSSTLVSSPRWRGHA